MKKCILLCLFAPLLFIACSDDDYVYPNVLTEMIDLVTDNTGTATLSILPSRHHWKPSCITHR